MKPDDDAAELTPQETREHAKIMCRRCAKWYREADEDERNAVLITIAANIEVGATLGIKTTGTMGALAMAMFAQLDALERERRAKTAASAAQGD